VIQFTPILAGDVPTYFAAIAAVVAAFLASRSLSKQKRSLEIQLAQQGQALSAASEQLALLADEADYRHKLEERAKLYESWHGWRTHMRAPSNY
jgi:hypothetical protein